MALEWIDGFDQYGPNITDMFDGVYAEIEDTILGRLSNLNPRTGIRHVRLNAIVNDCGLRRVISMPRASLGVGYAFSIDALPTQATSFALLQYRNNLNNPIFTLNVGVTGDLTITNGGRGGEPLANYPNPAVFTNSYQHVEVKYEAGVGIEVRLNEVPVLITDNLPSGITGGNVITSVKIGTNGFPLSGAPGVWDIDDLFCWNLEGDTHNDFLGDCKVYTRFPDSDVSPQDWDKATGANGYAMIDNNPPDDDNQYLTTDGSVLPARSVFTVPSLPLEIVEVVAVQLMTRTFKTDAGGAKIVAGIISGSGEEVSASHAIGIAPVWYSDVFDKDPNTDEDWTHTGASNIKVLVERTE